MTMPAENAMLYLAKHYGSANIGDYPESICKLIQVHRITCYRRRMGWKSRKLVLFGAMPGLTGNVKSIPANRVDRFYDHLIWQQESDWQAFLQASPVAQVEETHSITVMRRGEPREEVVSAPLGQSFQVLPEDREALLHCVRIWFKNDEFYVIG